MVAALEKVIRRLSGHRVGEAELTVALVPGTGIILKPLGSPKADEVSVDALELYRLLRERAQPPAPAEPALEFHAAARRLQELAAVSLSSEDGTATERERYLVTVRVMELCRRLRADSGT